MQVIVRQRPPSLGDNSNVVSIDSSSTTLSLVSSRSATTQDQNFKFKFRKVLGPETSQTDVFDQCGAPTIAGVLEGYNATIMAYGQTGAGKTHTITGGGEYETRGLSPRMISQVFSELAQRGLQSTVEHHTRMCTSCCRWRCPSWRSTMSRYLTSSGTQSSLNHWPSQRMTSAPTCEDWGFTRALPADSNI